MATANALESNCYEAEHGDMHYQCEMKGCLFVSLTINELLRHYRVTHEDNFTLARCCMNGCQEQFRTFSGFKSHIYRFHRQTNSAEQPIDKPIEQTTEVDDDCVLEPQDLVNRRTNLECDIQRLLGTDVTQQKRNSTLFILKMKEKYHLSQTAIDNIIGSSQALFDETVSRLHAGVRLKFAESGISPDMSADVDTVFSDLKDPFTGLETKYLQSKYFNETFHVPVSFDSCILLVR